MDGEAAQPRIRHPFADDRVEDDGQALGADDPGRFDVHLPRMYSTRRAVGQGDVREQVPASQPAVDVEQEEGATRRPLPGSAMYCVTAISPDAGSWAISAGARQSLHGCHRAL